MATTPDDPALMRSKLVVIEGMPGAGKTTLITTLARLGHRVLGEYTVESTAETLPFVHHPAVEDDDAHQANWLRKSAHASRLLRTADGPVFLDRDWLSALAYAYSIGDTDQYALLNQRTAWASRLLGAGGLLLGDTYVILQLNLSESLRRRSGRLRPEHPWSQVSTLRRLQIFYRHPVHSLARHAPHLSAQLGIVNWVHLPAITPMDMLRAVQALGGER